jgi:hypothetical protein
MTQPSTIPHQFPFRLVEKTETRHDGETVVVLGTGGGFLPVGEPWSVSLVAEALAQAILLLKMPEDFKKLRLAALNRVVVHRQIVAGDRLEVKVEEIAVFGSIRRYVCQARCGGALAASAEVTVTG